MANYDANIKVSADTQGAVRALNLLEQKIAKLGAGVELGKNVGRGVTEALVPTRALKQLDRELATIASRADTTAKKVARIFEGAATLGVASKGIQDVSQYLGDLAVTAGRAADQVNNLAGIKKILLPGFGAMQGTVNTLAKSISTLEYKFSSLQGGAEAVVNMLGSIGPVAGVAGAGIALVAGAIEDQLLRAMRQLDTEGTKALQSISEQTQALLKELSSFGSPRGGTAAQFEALLSKGQNRLRNSPAGSPESLRAVNTITTAQRLLNEELEKQNDLLREARGLAPQAVDNRATNSWNVNERRTKFLEKQAAEFAAVDEALARLERRRVNWADALGIDAMEGAARGATALESAYNKNQKALGTWADALREGAMWLKDLQQSMTAEAADSYSRALRNQQRTLEDYADAANRAAQAVRDLGYGGELPALRPAGFTNQDVRITNLLNDQKAAADILDDYINKKTKLRNEFEIDQILRLRNEQIDAYEEFSAARTKADEKWWAAQEARLRDKPDVRGAAANKQRNQRLESIALGVGFPLLFGGGAGTVGGSLVGSFIGSGFGGQILGGAIGQIIDQFAQAAADVGSSLRYPISSFEKLKEANLFAGKAQEYYIQRLIEVGRVTEATSAINQQIITKIGVTGVNDLTRLGGASSELSKAWAELNLQLQAAVAGPLAELLRWVTSIVRIFGESNRAGANVKDLLAGLSPEQQASLQKELLRNNQQFGISPRAQQEEAKILARYQALARPLQVKGQSLSPEDIDKARKAAEDSADRIQSAYREGFRLQQAGIDLERQALDLRRRVADDIFNKQQQVVRTQLEGEKLRRQIAIESVDLQYRRQIANEEGRAAQVLAAEADLMRLRAQGEAEIEARRKSLELDIAKQQRDTQNYVYQLNRDIDSIRRATLQYEMDVADYRLKIARQIQEQARLDGAATGAAAGVSAGVAGAGFTANQLTQASREAAKFTGVANMCSESVRAFYKSLGVSLPGVTAWADTVRKAGTVMKDWSQLRPGDIVASGRPGDTTHVGVYTGGSNVFHQSRSRGLVAGNYPDLNYFKQNGYFVRPNATVSQLSDAATQPRRPSIAGIPPNAAGGVLASLDAKDAQLKREQLTLQERLNKLGEDAAQQRLLEAARGAKDLEQRRETVALAKAELNAIVPGSRVVQERLAFEAQSLVKLEQRKAVDEQILQNTRLQGQARKELENALADGLKITEQQIALDREALKLAQDKAYAVQRAALESQLAVTGSGIEAGFMGNAASAYENALLDFGDAGKATEVARLTEQIDLARMRSEAWRTSLEGVSGAFADVLSVGVSSMITGTQTAKEVFANFLTSVAQTLQQTGAQMIATYVAIGIAKLFAGFGGGGGGGYAQGNVATDAFASGGIPGLSNTASIGTPMIPMRAAGGPVTSQNPYLVGENGPELFVPGTGGTVVKNRDLRDAMGTAPGARNGPMLNMTFQTTNIGGVEYVSRDQLEAAMAATRKAAANDGAKRGTAATLSKLQNSPSTRAKLGLR